MRGRLRLSTRRDDRGAVAPFAALMLIVLMLSGALVVDLGMQRVARADMQALADVVALDIARELDGRTAAVIQPLVPGLVDKAVDRNRSVLGWGSHPPTVRAEIGTMGADSSFTPVSGDAVPTAVQVTAETEASFAFAGVTGVDSGSATRDAVGEASNSVCFRLGTFAAAIRASDSTVLAPLNRLLGVNLDLASYQALAGTDVRLRDLAAQPVIGSPVALLENGLSYATLVVAMIDVLSRNSVKNELAITALERVLTVSGDLGQIRLADVLHVAPTDRAAMQIALNVLDILGTARLATGAHLLEIPNIQAGVAGLGNQFSGSLNLISAAELACGKPNTEQATADTAQLSGALGLEFINLPTLNVPLGIGTLQTAKATGSLVLDIADGTGRLVAPPEAADADPVHCGRGDASDPHSFSVEVATKQATYRLSTNVSIKGEVRLRVLDDLGLGGVLDDVLGGVLGDLLQGNGNRSVGIELEVVLSAGTPWAGNGVSMADLRLPPNDVTPVSTGTTVNLDPNIVPTVTALRIGGDLVPLNRLVDFTALLDPVIDELSGTGSHFLENTLKPLIGNINQMLVGPVARMVGLRFGGADVFAAGVVCGLPILRR